jgi:hypothetical protein
MRHTYWAGALAATLMFAGCGGDDHPAVSGEDPLGGKGSGGKGSGGKSVSTDGGDGGTASENGPTVKVTSPLESKTPADGVLSGQTLRVTCQVSKSAGGADVDASSVSVSLTDGKKAVVERVASPTANEDEYEADLVIATVEPGEVAIECQAKDRDGQSSSETISAFVDHGPQITVISPEANSAHPLKGGLDVTFAVAAVPLADDDADAEIGEVKFSFDGKECVVGDKDCDVTEISEGKYHANLLLDDPEKFPGGVSGAITITASNSRKPTPVSAQTSYSIVVDGDGPVINIESPAPQAVLGGKVKLIFSATDAGSGVDESTVNVTLYANGPKQFFDPDKGWSHVSDKFTYTFDTKLLEKDAPVQATINVRASDRVGNPSASGQSLTVYLDNVPPQVDLDPLNIRVKDGENCSGSMDPLGDKTVSDLAGQFGSPIANPFAFFRAFVNEQTNSSEGQTLFYFSGTDQKQVRLYIQPDPTHQATPLLVNKNPASDTSCDDVGGVDAVANPLPFNALNPIDTGNKVGVPTSKLDANEVPIVGAECKLSDAAPPPALCPSHGSGMTYVPFNFRLKEPYVYVVGNPVQNTDSCTGIDLNFLTTGQPDGWVCAAARVVDKAGNVGISPPIRICVDDGAGEPPACRVSSTQPPSCTDGCVPPARGGGFIVAGQ